MGCPLALGQRRAGGLGGRCARISCARPRDARLRRSLTLLGGALFAERAAALLGERLLSRDQRVHVVLGVRWPPRLAALGELDRPPRAVGRLRGLMPDDLKSRRLDRPIVRSRLQRRQPIAALHLRLGELFVVRVRSQRRLSRLSARRDRAIDERLQDRVQCRPPLPSVGGQVHRLDPLRHGPIGLRPPLRVRRVETERLSDQLDLTRIRRNIDQKIDRGLRPQLDEEADDIPAQGQGFLPHGQIQIEQTMNNYQRPPAPVNTR